MLRFAVSLLIATGFGVIAGCSEADVRADAGLADAADAGLSAIDADPVAIDAAAPAIDAATAADAVVAADAVATDAAARDAAPVTDSGPPSTLRAWLVGDPADAIVASAGPGLILMGGGSDVDAAYAWAARRTPGGDALVLRASGADGYQRYLFDEIGGFDSVETLLFSSRSEASDPWVLDRVRGAELVYFAGGDQGRYVELWANTPLAALVTEAYARGATIGGTSAGEMILGDVIFSAMGGSVVSADALADPSSADITLVPRMFDLAPLRGVLLDSHFAQRDRYGRLVVFLARSGVRLALGVDEATALLVDAAGAAEVVGRGAVYAVAPVRVGALTAPLDGVEVSSVALRSGERITLPLGTTTGSASRVRVVAGALSPSDPY